VVQEGPVVLVDLVALVDLVVQVVQVDLMVLHVSLVNQEDHLALEVLAD
jgi:hypothetical protein